MRKALILIPFMFLGLKPYNQVHKDKEIVSIESKDSIYLQPYEIIIKQNISLSKELDKRKDSLKKELKRLKKEKIQHDKIKKSLDNFNNRGL